MTTNDADRRLTAWLEAAAPPREPDHLLDAVLERTARTRRRPAWRIPERWTSMTTISVRAVSGGRFAWQLAAATVLLVLALVAGAALLAGSRQVKVPPPFGPAANGSFAFETGGDLLVRDAATGAISTLAADPGIQAAPTYSLDGTQLAWLHATDPAADEPEQFELRVARADGTDVRPLGTFDHVGRSAWSPAGDTIAIEAEIGGEPSISMIDVRTGESTLLGVGMAARSPAFRPGGKQLVFGGRPTGEPWGLYVAGVDGTNPVRLSLDPGFENDVNYVANQDYYFLAPAWSPNGDRIAFHTLDDETLFPTDSDPGWRVHVADVDAAGTVTNEIVLPSDPSIDDEFNPVWLPDASGLVIHRVDAGAHSLVRWSVTASPVAAGAELVLRVPSKSPWFDDLSFGISPDGMQAAAWEPQGGSWILPLDGGPAVSTALVIDGDATWQRLAP